MKVKHTVAVIVFVAAIAAFIGLTATNTFALPTIPMLQQEQVKQDPQSLQTITETDKDSKADRSEVEVETETKDDADEQLEAETETNEDSDEVDAQQASQATITADEAKAIAVKHVSAQLSDVREVELENENGHLVYSVEIARDGKLFEVEVDAINGTVMILEQDDDSYNGNEETETNEDADEQVNPQQASQSTITAEEAKEIAVKHVGAQLSDVREVELESEGGKLIYSVEIVKDGKLVEVEIDATNGNVIAVEHGDD